MAGWLYMCPSCGGEATVPDEYVGQTVQCPHCDQLFVATAPTADADQPCVPTPSQATEPPQSLETDAAPETNPAENEPLPQSQEKYQDAETVGQLLLELRRVTEGGEVQLSNESGVHEVAELIETLPSEVLNARITTRGGGYGGEYIEAQVSGFLKSRAVAFRFNWSSTRRGWSGDWPAANMLHYYVPKNEISDPPYCSDGMLVSLCKRSFYGCDRPFHRNDQARRCSICLERRGKMLGFDAPKKPKKKAQRITLTKAQTETPSGRRLLQLISQLADDHKLDTPELEQFRQSLNEPELQEFTATDWLKDTLDDVLADGYVTREEYYAVAASILRVLPAPIRDDWERRMRSSERPATDKQVDYIKGLGGEVTEGMTVRQASALIDTLLRVQGRNPDEF